MYSCLLDPGRPPSKHPGCATCLFLASKHPRCAKVVHLRAQGLVALWWPLHACANNGSGGASAGVAASAAVPRWAGFHSAGTACSPVVTELVAVSAVARLSSKPAAPGHSIRSRQQPSGLRRWGGQHNSRRLAGVHLQHPQMELLCSQKARRRAAANA